MSVLSEPRLRMTRMRLDHLSYAAGPDGLAATAKTIGSLLGATFADGGIHPRFGTVNMTLALADGTYLEIVEALDHPASDKAPFGQAVKARSALGGGWLGWVVAVDDISVVEAAPGTLLGHRQPAPPRRHRAALAPDRRQRHDRRPAAALLRPVGHRGRPAPLCWAPTTVSPLPAWRSPVTRSGSASGSARPSRPPRGRQGRVGRSARHPGHPRGAGADAERSRPDLSLPERSPLCPGRSRARTSGSTPRPTRSRTAPSTPTADSGRPWSRAPVGGARRARPRLRHRLPPAGLRAHGAAR